MPDHPAHRIDSADLEEKSQRSRARLDNNEEAINAGSRAVRGTSPTEKSGADPGGDAALVGRILADPSAGWAEAWDRYGHRLHGYCRRRVDDSNEADDVVADVFMVASQRIGTLRDPSAFRAWLYAIARRRVQETWRDRERSTPVDPHGETAMSATTAPPEISGADEAAELVSAASASLNDRDRDLLTLALEAGLDTGEIARITGDSVSFVSVRVNRLKERIGRAAGALLVARHHRRDCDELQTLLAPWDGTFDSRWRKRIARHVDACPECGERRKAAAAVFAAPLVLAAPSDLLRDRVMHRINSARPTADSGPVDVVVPDLGPWDDGGFPATTRGRRLPIALAITAAVLVLVIGGVFLLTSGGDDDVVAADTAKGTTTSPPQEPEESPPGGWTDPPPETTTTTTTTTTAPPAPQPPVTQVSIPTTTAPPPESTTTSTTVPAPTVSISVAPNPIAYAMEDTVAWATITVAAHTDGVATTVSWDGPDAGQVIVPGVGTHGNIAIGPLLTPPPVGEVPAITVTATVTDGAGGTATAATTLTVEAYLV